MVRALLVSAIGCACLTWSATSDAWYFPEHAVIARDAIDHQAPEIRAVIHDAVDQARAQGLPLCSNVTAGLENLSATPMRTANVRAPAGVDCVPFAVLPAIAADHSDGSAELRGVVAGQRGRELATAAAYEWRRFLEEGERAPKAPVERMSFVHELDVAFYYIDPGYHLRAGKTRAHFVDAGRPLDQVVKNAGIAGAIDNAVGQFLAHHLRSLELASRGRAQEALLEHGFAVHFLEDAFSAGHLVMNETLWLQGNDWARRRHDFYDARGIRVTRASSVEPCAALEEAFEADLPPCWTTMGDGYLGATSDSSDRVHVMRAVMKAQVGFALALDPARVQRLFDGLGQREKIAFAEYFDPMPWWTLPREVRRARPPSVEYAERLVHGAVQAALRLREEKTEVPAIDVPVPPRRALFDAEIASTAANPCIPSTGDDDVCGPGKTLALGSVGASLLRPMLVELPAAVDDVNKLAGQEEKDHGLAFHLLASGSIGALFPPRAPVDFYAPSLGVSMGIAYRFGTYLPGRRDRSAVELNASVSTALHYDSNGRAGGHPQVTMLTQEIRFPIVWELIASYMPPFDLRKVNDSGFVILFGGARIHEVVTDPAPKLWGVDLEIAAVALSQGRGAYPLYSVSPEIRLHAGFADPSVVQSLGGAWGPTISLSFVGGYATFF